MVLRTSSSSTLSLLSFLRQVCCLLHRCRYLHLSRIRHDGYFLAMLYAALCFFKISDQPMMSWNVSHPFHLLTNCDDAAIARLLVQLADLTNKLGENKGASVYRFVHQETTACTLLLIQRIDWDHHLNSHHKTENLVYGTALSRQTFFWPLKTNTHRHSFLAPQYLWYAIVLDCWK